MARKSSGRSNAKGSSADGVVSLVFSVLVALAMLFGAVVSSDKTAKKAALVAIVVLVVLVQLYDLAR